MGIWNLESVLQKTTLHDTSELFGNHYIVNFRLRYTPSTFGKYVETPKLSWFETILMKEHHKTPRSHWKFETNMYTHNPLSKTLEVWAKRYILAYNNSAGIPNSGKGYVRLMDKHGAPVPKAKLANANSDVEKAEAVRNYIKGNGCVLFIEVDDIPSINIPTGTDHKERLLIFNCGVEGGGPKTQAIQYLDVDGARPKSAWTRRFDLSWTMTTLDTTGFTQVPPPPMVSNPRAPLFAGGEYW
jgi:hypothetical protein